jgi:hypothetical protein
MVGILLQVIHLGLDGQPLMLCLKLDLGTGGEGPNELRHLRVTQNWGGARRAYSDTFKRGERQPVITKDLLDCCWVLTQQVTAASNTRASGARIHLQCHLTNPLLM